MPCKKEYQVDTSRPVLVTGATGYLAGVLIRELLNKGLTVHGTVRDPTQKDRLQYLYDVADSSSGTLRLFAADLMKSGSFAEAMKDCYIVFHVASPFVLGCRDPQEDLIRPAQEGTANVLNQASQTPSVQRVVLTSSTAAIYNMASDSQHIPGGVMNEDVWNRTATLDSNAYYLSKTLAEQTAWEIAGGQTQWKLVVANPAMIIGPGLKYHPEAESFKLIQRMGMGPMFMGAPALAVPMVDVRDAVAGHMACAFVPEASGRNLLIGHNTDLAEMGMALVPKYGKEYPVPTRVLLMPKPLLWLVGPYVDSGLTRPIVVGNVNIRTTFDNSKSKKELGMEYLPLEQSVQEMFQQIIDAGAMKVNRFYLF